ncbi:uncharacterized protein LOC100141806 [Tribolium castaneum]|uniref:Uncharacterized protein n=1 Tax=Tribolium castaneum TaxID=7070 RepID=D6X3A2_TRICA|nr:PREDICTED: uncharacterized protein LOC100141806 [Tribolium castaneum]EFA09779.1 hypothetical protein TcasGA2_TC011921 [Tribolium castaneum]|eukprot:XP_001812931.1 PREDICTED: uncharacterized protein LOC100141806 [Tribolium castaneum]
MEPTEESQPEAPEPGHSTNITQEEIDPETASKLRGDAIGNTMYSERFVLNTLMQFSDLKWSEEVENDLCVLWDMTEEKDVCEFLYRLSYPTLACTALANYTEPRFVEIVVGIFANLLCSKCESNVKEDEIRAVLDLLNSDDPYILIQVMRFLHALAFMCEKLDFFERRHFDKIMFILNNSTNRELLTVSLKALAALTDGTKLPLDVITPELLSSTLAAYKTLKNPDCESEVELFESQEQHLNAKHLIQIHCNICTYIDNFIYLTQYVAQIKANLGGFNFEMALLLRFYKEERNLIPMSDDFKFYVEAMTYIFKTIHVEFHAPIVRPLCEIYFIVNEKEPANLRCVAELICYFISVGTLNTIRRNFDNVPLDIIKNLLISIEGHKFKFDFEYIATLRRIALLL